MKQTSAPPGFHIGGDSRGDHGASLCKALCKAGNVVLDLIGASLEAAEVHWSHSCGLHAPASCRASRSLPRRSRSLERPFNDTDCVYDFRSKEGFETR